MKWQPARHTKIFKIIIACSFYLAGCTYSIPETYLRNQRPESFKTYHKGPIPSLSQADIQEAIEFGKTNKFKQDVIDYAFIFKKYSSRLGEINPRSIYILFITNFYLIANYAAQQTRNYQDIDIDYVNFLAHLPTFRVEAVEQRGDIFYPHEADINFALFKNGNKMGCSKENPLYQSHSPYTFSHLSGQSDWQTIMNETVKQSIEMANKITAAYQKDTNINLDKLNLQDTNPSHLYNYKDVDMDSKYEVIVIFDDREIRIPINFATIK